MKCAFTAAVLAVVAFVSPNFADDQDRINQSIGHGIDYLKVQIARDQQVGETALMTLAMIKSVPTEQMDLPAIKIGLAKLSTRIVNGVYQNDRQGGTDNYESALVLLAFAAADPELYLPQIEAVAKYILSKQMPSGAWGYSDGRQDTSMTQYACLGLKAASDAGVKIPKKVWDDAMYWFVSRQDVSGGFTYHPIAPEGKWPIPQSSVTHSMSTGGTASLYICRMQLPYLQTKNGKKPNQSTSLLRLVIGNLDDVFEPKVTYEVAKRAIDRAEKWMNSNFKIEGATGPLHYFLYALERYAVLSNTPKYNLIYRTGVDHILDQQKPDGHWDGAHGAVVDTAFTLLFLGKSTMRAPPKDPKLLYSQGVMVGGRGVPKQSEIMGADRFRWALDSENLQAIIALKELNDSEFQGDNADPEIINAASIVAAAKGDLNQLSRLAQHSKFEVRLLSYSRLTATKDIRAIPSLIGGLTDHADKDGLAYSICRAGLLSISRKTETFGLPVTKNDPKRLAEGITAWNNWYQSQRVELTAEQEFDLALR